MSSFISRAARVLTSSPPQNTLGQVSEMTATSTLALFMFLMRRS